MKEQFEEFFIRTYTNAGETVMDNTMGSGTTGVACVNKEDERRITTCPPELMAQLKGINKNPNAGRA